jgi:hypothetical protein
LRFMEVFAIGFWKQPGSKRKRIHEKSCVSAGVLFVRKSAA